MAATGGGKLRSRRYHTTSKPYAKGRQQPSGLISRVTDTVKSIVPSWLQKYFRNEGETSAAGVERNNVAPPPSGSDEAPPLPDGRVSPEANTSYTEPSTSRASLSFSEALSRPPLKRTHLHFSSLDGSPALRGVSSPLLSQPSTSSAPFTGSPFAVTSSFSLVKEMKDSSSQHEDDNISTTSGFSSRASEKEVSTSKSVPLLWTPETEHTQSAHTGLKKPAFSLSVFGTSSSSVLSSSALNSSQLGDSPFYPGKTTYGGAAAIRSAHSRPAAPYQPPVRRQIKAKPAGNQACGVSSATARRILQSLERMSSPLADAKRIPSVSSPLSTSLNHTDLDVSNFHAKRKRLESSVAPVQKLMVPAAAVVSGNRVSFRPSLNPGGQSRGVHKTNCETPVRQSPPASDSSQVPPPSTPAGSSSGSGGGKMKRERSIRPSSKPPEDEVSEEPDLPPVSLPSNFTLPKFNFSSPPPISSMSSSRPPPTTISKERAEKKCNEEPAAPSTPPSAPFTFSSPIVKASAASPPSFSPSSGFTFSAPAMKTSISYSNGKIPPTVEAVKSAANEEEEFEGPFTPAKVLKQGSVLDILKGSGFMSSVQSAADRSVQTASVSQSAAAVSAFSEKFRPPAGSWNCGTCMLQNQSSHKTCVACLSPQPSSDSPSDSKPADAAPSISAVLTRPAGSWDCDTCMVSNKPEVVKCVACDTTKPGTAVKSSLPLPPVSEALSDPPTAAPANSSISTETGLMGFGDKFKKPEGSWDCDVCMLQNKAQDMKCVACQNPKPGAAAAAVLSPAPLLGFGDKFKKPEGSWECEVCCVQNKAEDQQCVACQSAKPGAKTESKGFSSSFGVQSNSTDSSSSSFKFGTGSSDSASAGLKFGGTFSDSSSTGGFNFGVKSSGCNSTIKRFLCGSSSSDAPSGGFKLSNTSPEPTTITSLSDEFIFPPPQSKEKTTFQGSTNGFLFSGSSEISFGSQASSSENSTFLFEAKPLEKGSSDSSFTFSVPQSKTEKVDSPATSETLSTITTTAGSSIPVFGQPLGASPAAPKFGEQATKEPAPVTSTFTFGKPEEDTSVPSGTFLFTAAKEAENSAASVGFTFSKQDPPKDLPKSTFTFSKPAETTEVPKPSFGFCQSLAETSAPKSEFSFMANSTSAPASSSSTPSLFGTSTTSAQASAPAPTSTFLFGQSSSSEPTPAKTFVFGQQQDSQSAPLAAPAPAQPFQFGLGSNSSAPGFTFGAAASSTPASADPAPTANPSPFVFSSATPSSGFGSGQTPIFGQGTSQPGAPAFGSAASSFSATASPAFGAKPSSAPVFGQQPNSVPSFGSATAPTAQGGFQFGSSAGFGSAGGVFGFAGGSTTPAASSAMPTPNTTSSGGFNFSQTPTFNIGSSKSFAATPSGPNSIAGRKIKTAVRRRK